MSSDTTTNRARRPYTFGKLYDLLEEHFPDHRSVQKVFNVPALAKDLDFTPETIYRAVRGDVEAGFPEGILKVPTAHKIIKFSHANHPEQPLMWDDLLPFLLPEYDDYS